MHRCRLIKRALAQAVFVATAGLVLLFVLRHRTLGATVCALAFLGAVCSVFAPKVYLAFERANRAAARAVGIALTCFLLTLVYVTYFLPGRLLLILLRQDPLCRKFRPAASTYWSSYRPPKFSEPYRRQY